MCCVSCECQVSAVFAISSYLVDHEYLPQSMLKLDSKTKELEAKRVNFRLRRVVKWTEWCDIGNDAFSPPSSPATPCINQSFITIKGLGDKGGTLKEGISKINEVLCLIHYLGTDSI